MNNETVSDLKRAMPLDPLYYGANDGKVHEKTVDYYKTTRYNKIVNEMLSTCWRCNRSPLRYKPCCVECVKKHLNKDLPDLRYNIKNKEAEDDL